jgi:hypothetical protein
VVANERYYNVSEDIKELFSSSNEKFSFLTDMGRDSDNSDSSMDDSSANDMTSKSSSIAPKWIKNINRVQSSSSSEDSEMESAKVIPTDSGTCSVGSGRETRLFFHSSIPKLRNRLDENSFYRSEALSELEAGWPQRRAAMKQSFRKRRKDATKRTRKKQKIQ